MRLIITIFLFVFTNISLFSQNSDTINNIINETINRAIKNGDCKTLHAFVQETTGKDPKLLTSANQTLRKYSAIDGSTTKYRTNRMAPRVRSIGKELSENVFINPRQYLPDIVAKLIGGVNDQFSKTKILHDWICDNISYDTEMYFVHRQITNQDYVSILKKKKAVCSGYTNLFNEMCNLAGIESIGISGYSKGFGYSGTLGANSDHDWNAVRINNKWYLVDVTWDAGYVDHKTFIKKYTTNYLFLDSRSFLYSHLPINEKFQFYAPVLTKEQFVIEPLIRGAYFKYGLVLKTDLPLYNNSISETFSFDIELKNSNTSITSSLKTKQQQNIEGADWTSRRGSTVTLFYDIPDGQEYEGYLFARMKNDKKIQEAIDMYTYEQRILPSIELLLQEKKITEKEKDYFLNSYYKVDENKKYYFLEDQFDTPRNNAVIKIHPLAGLSLEMYEGILDFNIKPESGYKGFKSSYNKRFPDTYASYGESLNTNLVSPIKGELKAGTEETFIIESKDFSRLAIIMDGQYNFFTKNTAGAFELKLIIPAETNEINIFGTKNNRNYTGILKFNIQSE